MGLVSPARGMQVWRVEGKYLGTQAHGRRHTGGFPIDLGGIAGETALVRGEMVSRACAGGAAVAPPAGTLEIFFPQLGQVSPAKHSRYLCTI